LKLLAAQRVQSTDGVVGINVFHYSEEGNVPLDVEFDALDGRAVLVIGS